MKKIDIALFIPILELGGFQGVFISLANGMAALGHRVRVVTFDPDGDRAGEIDDRVEVVALSPTQPGWLKRLSLLSAWMKSHEPEVFLAGMQSANCLAIAARRKAGVRRMRLVISDHQSHMTRVREGDKRARVIVPLIRTLYRQADRVIAVSHGVAGETAEICPYLEGRISVIYNPVVDDVFRQKMQGVEPHPWFDDAKTPVVCGMSRLTEIKNFPLLIGAFADFKRRTGSRAKLVIIGDGPERAHLENCVAETGYQADIELAGSRANPMALIQKADLFVHPSDREGFGNVIVEALAAGTPVVATDCPNGPAEILEDGKWGRLVPMKDRAAMADAIEASLAERHAAPEEAVDRFRAETIVEQYLEVVTAR